MAATDGGDKDKGGETDACRTGGRLLDRWGRADYGHPDYGRPDGQWQPQAHGSDI